ncbi:diguanylate cyclase [Paenibacillus glucanolyticus]|uniref:Diguanylate cyclase n=2 Tax=Paenibacillus glucanolyticus TaxID=59843 RepID=A0A163JQ14_9BACL|nr:GGDEF domain-containing protein [Paenibacillus glucanolyticus]KZS46723.1 diguanylate cyclase [Paenibacillus glucanolyticus]MPY15526.1 GGDEF domain-containing protein [Paenibacillus glucanolyticus]
MSPTPADHLWIRLAIIYAFIQIMTVLWMPDALSLQRVLVIIAPMAASVYLIRVSRRYKAHLRRFWFMVSIGLMADAAARIVSSFFFGFGKESAFQISSYFWGLEVILFASCLIYLFRHVQGPLRGLRFMLDIVIVGVTFMTVGWEYLIKPELQDSTYSGGTGSVWVDMLFPLCGMVLILFTVVLYFNTRQLGKWAVISLSLGGSAYIMGDALHFYLVHFVNLEVRAYLDPLHTLSVFFIASAGAQPAPDTGNQTVKEREPRPVGTLIVRYLLPYGVLGGMFALMAQRFGGWNGLFTGLSLCVILILFRQILIQYENDRLLHRLHESLRQSESLAHRDDLTGLYNRRYFNARLSSSLLEADRTGSRVGLLYMDMNRFKKVNDRYGHRAGDLLIRKVACRLQSLESKGILVSRLGGDEFTVMIQSAGEDQELIWMAEEIWMLLSEPYELEGYEVRTSPSIGIAVYPDHARNDQELIGRADAAMYAAKERNARWHFDVDRTMQLQLLDQKIE